MNSEKTNSWDVLNKVKTPLSGMLKCLYEIRFTCNKELTDKQKESGFACLNMIAEGDENDKEARAWCYEQLGLIYAGRSNFIQLVKS